MVQPGGQSLAWLREAAAATKLFGENRSLSSQGQGQKQRGGQDGRERKNRGYHVYEADSDDDDDDADDDDGTHYMPMATRRNELFVVVDNTIRWADLERLKEQWEEEKRKGSAGSEGESSSPSKPPAWKTLRFKQHERIRQLVVSPNEELMAVVTEHNVAVVVLPDPAQLLTAAPVVNKNNESKDGGKDQQQKEAPQVRVKTHTIGPTTHVVSASAVVRALWHPVGVGGNCLVTVTAAAEVRVWELDGRTLSSFGEPTLALDLKKLRYARSAAQDDVAARDMTANRTYSADDVDMEVTAACFGANAGEAQAFAWSPATLWLTMAQGDVFALCPLLPSRFQPDEDGTLIPLHEFKIAQRRALDNASADADGDANRTVEKARVQAQCTWLGELVEQHDNFDAYDSNDKDDDGPGGRYAERIYELPRSQGPVPALQGPFVIVPDEIQDELTPCDVHVVGASAAALLANALGEPGLAKDSTEDGDDLGTSFSTVCILSTDGRVHICIDVDGIEPRWLPKTRAAASAFGASISSYSGSGGGDDGNNDSCSVNGTGSELLLFEALDTLRPQDADEGRLPMFTASSDADEYTFYVTHGKGVYQFSLEPWIHELEAEIQNSGTEGVKFRTQVLSKGPGTVRHRVLRVDPGESKVATPVVFGTPELGRVLLAVQGQTPHAVAFLDPDVDEEPAPLTWKPGTELKKGLMTDLKLDRDVYVPSSAFSANTDMTSFLEKQVDARHRRLLKDEIRLSPATLSVITDAHRILSKETTTLNNAVAELFRRCDRLHDEFKHQVQRASELAGRIREFNDAQDNDGGVATQQDGSEGEARRKDAVQRRIHEAKERNERLMTKYDQLKRRLARAGGKPLSNKEKAWMTEVKKVQASAGETNQGEDEDQGGSRKMLIQRYEEVQSISKHLVGQAKELEADTRGEAVSGDDGKVPPDIRRHKMAQMQDMLARETALVDAAMEKLARLGLTGPS